MAVAGAMALGIGSILLIRFDRPPPRSVAPPAHRPAVADVKPFVPWSPDGPAVDAAQATMPREGPYTLLQDAPRLPSEGGFVTLLGDGLQSDRFYISEHSNEGSFQGGKWVKENIKSGPDGLRLDVTPTAVRDSYALSELQVKGRYGYGRYEVIMRPAKGSGLVSAFFTYTGPYFGDPHDEIDIEFVGSSTSIIQLNYFHNGRKGRFANIKLPFDAAEQDHLYAFDWKPEGISWYVDGELIYQTPENDPHIPTTPGQIHISNWTGTPELRQWHGTPDFGDRGSAYFSCISFTPLGENTRRCADVFRPGTQFPPPADLPR